MTDKELILHTLYFLRDKKEHTKIDEIWKDLDEDTKSTLKIILEENGLATPHPYTAYSFLITSTGLKVLKNPSLLNVDGNINKIAEKQISFINQVALLVWLPAIYYFLEIIKTICRFSPFAKNCIESLLSTMHLR